MNRWAACLLAWGVLAASVDAGAAERSKSLVIAVLPLQNDKAGDSNDWIGRSASAAILSKLNAVPGVTIAETTQLDKLIQEMRLQTAELLDPATAVKVGKMAGAHPPSRLGRARHGARMMPRSEPRVEEPA